MEWRDRQWNRPDLTHHYLMQIALHVTRGYAKYPNQVKMDQFKLEFKDSSEPPAEAMSDAQASAIMKAKWIAMMGMPVTVIKAPPPSPADPKG